jgi:bifunctional DNA-binding transcriptional regulator/antitoxin component of YhaV-PrlF toxin-antitoxin module
MFIQIPADIREKFDNDPEKFVDFMNDENNISALQDMGILVKKDSISSPKETLNANEVSEAP